MYVPEPNKRKIKTQTLWAWKTQTVLGIDSIIRGPQEAALLHEVPLHVAYYYRYKLWYN